MRGVRTIRRGLRSMQAMWQADPDSDNSDVFTGTIAIGAAYLAPDPYYDFPELRATQPIARFGNLLVFRGTFHLPQQRAARLAYYAMDNLYSSKRDPAKAERLLKLSQALNPNSYFVGIELGNLLCQRGARDGAVQAYQAAKAHAPAGEEIVGQLERQIQRLEREDPKLVPPVRDPLME